MEHEDQKKVLEKLVLNEQCFKSDANHKSTGKKMGYNKNRRKAKDEGQLPNRTKTFPHVPNSLTQENREDKEINGIKNYPANTSNESVELDTRSCSS